TNVQFRQATFIEASVGSLKEALVESTVVVALVLIVFLMNGRATLVSLAAIPLSILMTLIVFAIMGLTINTMTLGGLAIAIGELVDDAVVDVENILRRLNENRARPDPRPVLAVIAAAAGAAFVLPRTFLPPFAEGTLDVSLQYNPGISLAESNRLGLIAERLLMNVPEVGSVGRRTGRAELDEHAEGVHFSEIDVDLVRSTRSKPEIYADIRERLSALPASIAIGQPISHRLDHLQSGIRAQIVLKIFGDDLETLRRLAETTRHQLASVPGLVDLQVEKQVLIPQLRIQVDYERAALYGLTPAAVTQALDALSNGRRVSQIVDGNRRFDVMMRLSDQDRSTT